MNEQIEAIRAEIERRIKEYDAIIESQPDSNRSERDAWKWAEDKSLLSFIDSLPEETAPKGYDEAYLNECIAKASKTGKGVDVDKYMDEVRGNRPIISNGSLEDEMINYWGRIPDDKDLIDTARHFALWQKEQMMDEWLQDRDGCFWDGVEEGKKAMKEQMMKEAVEGEVVKTFPEGVSSIHYLAPAGIGEMAYFCALKGLNIGHKVRIVTIKAGIAEKFGWCDRQYEEDDR